MQVDSYLEIFTTLYGWAFANIIGELLTGTGLIALPFMTLAFQIWRDAKESASNGASGLGLSEAVQVKIILMIFVFTLCYATTPFTTLSKLSYEPVPTDTDPNPVTASIEGGTGSTYDEAMRAVVDGSISSTGSLSSVPAWWFFVMAVSSGVNSSVRAGINNSDASLRDIEAMGRMAAIHDPKVHANVQRFYNECYIPARSLYLRGTTSWNEKISPQGAAILDPANPDYGPTDVDWMGSMFFRTEPGFYDGKRSDQPVEDFPVDPQRDTDYVMADPNINPDAPPGSKPPEWGRPTCNQWWLDPDVGVRAQIINSTGGLSAWVQKARSVFKSEDEAADAYARMALINDPPAFVDVSHQMGNHYDLMTRATQVIGGTVGMSQSFGKLVAAFMAFFHQASALMILQALTLMAIYALLPLIVFLSGYSIEVMFYGGVAIFTVKFWTVLWMIAEYVDARLWNAMYPGMSGNMIVQEVSQLASGNGEIGHKRMLLDIILIGMYISLPMIWSGMMTWISINVGRVLSDNLRDTTGKTTHMRPPKPPSPEQVVKAAATIAKFFIP